MGAMSWSSGPSGKTVRYLNGTTVYSAKVPSTFRPDCNCCRHLVSPPSLRHIAHVPQISRCHATPTRCPSLTCDSVNPEPSCTARPTPSWPRMRHVGPSSPDARAISVPQTPVTVRRTRTSSEPSLGREPCSIANCGLPSSLCS